MNVIMIECVPARPSVSTRKVVTPVSAMMALLGMDSIAKVGICKNRISISDFIG